MATDQFILYQKGYDYRIQNDYHHQLPQPFFGHTVNTQFIDLSPDGMLTIRKGYASDGPSGPTIDTKTFMRGAFVHDALYQLMREGHLPRELKNDADRELQRWCIADGMWKIRAWWVYRGVKKFGTSSTIHNKDIMVAP